MSKALIIKRVNSACNYWADTSDVDYCECLSWEEILEEDKQNFALLFFFKKELSKCGY